MVDSSALTILFLAANPLVGAGFRAYWVKPAPTWWRYGCVPLLQAIALIRQGSLEKQSTIAQVNLSAIARIGG